MATVTNSPNQVSNFVRDISAAVASYDHIRWHRSKDGADGTYVARTLAAAAPAVLTIQKTGPHQLNGKTLSLMNGGVSQVDVLFATADPVSATAAAAEIDAASALFTAVAQSDDTITITNAATGTGSSIEVLSGDANTFLGLTAGDGALGVDAATVLVAGTHGYPLPDPNPGKDCWDRV